MDLKIDPRLGPNWQYVVRRVCFSVEQCKARWAELNELQCQISSILLQPSARSSAAELADTPRPVTPTPTDSHLDHPSHPTTDPPAAAEPPPAAAPTAAASEGATQPDIHFL